MGEFVIPDLLAGSNSLMIGQTLWLEFFTNKDWPVGLGRGRWVLLVLLVGPLVLYDRLQRRGAGGQGGDGPGPKTDCPLFNITALALGLAFLYLPIVILVIYSFNAQGLVHGVGRAGRCAGTRKFFQRSRHAGGGLG